MFSASSYLQDLLCGLEIRQQEIWQKAVQLISKCAVRLDSISGEASNLLREMMYSLEVLYILGTS